MTDWARTADDRTIVVLRPDGVSHTTRRIALEAPVAVEVDGFGYAVMMMTPADLEAFATGFMLTERLADTAADVIAIEPFKADTGWILRIALSERCRGRIHDRVRHRTSDTGCGLCGISGLEQLRRPIAGSPPRPTVQPAALFAALAGLRAHQPLNAATGAVHAAAVCDAEGRIVAAYEDVGRHNALDKLIGATALAGSAIDGFIVVTSRISFEMVDKALVAGAPLLMGVSAPTTLAIEHAAAHDLTLLALARGDAILVANDPWKTFGHGSEGGT
ncbi:formate dehydrogenase accessory sulfurtransferase FdhD [Microvirga sp. SRT01]|uniref:Sulfur carrier protein FdhD n=1 Tax=Sphingomonas longa TaxID=2778730 RepID=A0ABS2DBT8_9SPHN|nr:formate dehydrogenase accessory sulfurtransferase FdhD [Microvirga sp. SRT01]MBM6578397.1 formate dehydrogenase accessory sulfurtransferase FdhD [Sphingomonas sp. BT552]MBR7711437.1 formate dehydrogenase accessory sulfurtransferase FdhD [Microvirga sp. SRT01]